MSGFRVQVWLSYVLDVLVFVFKGGNNCNDQCLGAMLVQFHLPDSKIRTLRGSLNFALVTALVGTLIQSFTPIEGKLKT